MTLLLSTFLTVCRSWLRLLSGRCDRCGGEVAVSGEIKRVCRGCGAHVW